MQMLFLVLAIMKVLLAVLFGVAFSIGMSEDKKVARLTKGKTILKTNWDFLVLCVIELFLSVILFIAAFRN